MNKLLIFGVAFCCTLFAQGTPAPQVLQLTTQDKYLRYLLMTFGTPGADPAVVQANEKAMTSLLSLNSDELATLQSLGAQYGTLITTFRKNRQAILSSATVISPSMRATLNAYVTQLDSNVQALANTILPSVRQETAARIISSVAGIPLSAGGN